MCLNCILTQRFEGDLESNFGRDLLQILQVIMKVRCQKVHVMVWVFVTTQTKTDQETFGKFDHLVIIMCEGIELLVQCSQDLR